MAMPRRPASLFLPRAMCRIASIAKPTAAPLAVVRRRGRNRDEARLSLIPIFAIPLLRRLRSPGRAHDFQERVRNWLDNCRAVLPYVQTRAAEDDGAVAVLLSAPLNTGSIAQAVVMDRSRRWRGQCCQWHRRSESSCL